MFFFKNKNKQPKVDDKKKALTPEEIKAQAQEMQNNGTLPTQQQVKRAYLSKPNSVHVQTNKTPEQMRATLQAKKDLQLNEQILKQQGIYDPNYVGQDQGNGAELLEKIRNQSAFKFSDLADSDDDYEPSVSVSDTNVDIDTEIEEKGIEVNDENKVIRMANDNDGRGPVIDR